MHPHATIAVHNLGIDLSIIRVCLQSQQNFVLFSINGRIRLLPLKSESLESVPFLSVGVVLVYCLSRVMSKHAFCITAQPISTFVITS